MIHAVTIFRYNQEQVYLTRELDTNKLVSCNNFSGCNIALMDVPANTTFNVEYVVVVKIGKNTCRIPFIETLSEAAELNTKYSSISKQ